MKTWTAISNIPQTDEALLRAELEAASKRLTYWLNNSALPIWLNQGLDANGGFFERINQDGSPSRSDLRRMRVQPRQAYCYAAAGLNNWTGDWERGAMAGLDWMERVYRRDDGLYGNIAKPDGTLIDERFDLYNQAFAIFAYSQIAAAFPMRANEMETNAALLLGRLHAHLKHPLVGFEEDTPPRYPLCSNPHMHMFEAALAWEIVAKEKTPWIRLADEIAGLATTFFVDSESGVLREFFDKEWKEFPSDAGRIVEPGHQFEWAWLLARWGLQRKNSEALAKARRLFDIGMTHGICTIRKVAVMQLNDDYSPRDMTARMWCQTEWLKSAVLLAHEAGGLDRCAYLASAVAATRAFERFLGVDIEGLWLDKLTPEGSWVNEPAPASTFYHIVGAIYELSKLHG